MPKDAVNLIQHFCTNKTNNVLYIFKIIAQQPRYKQALLGSEDTVWDAGFHIHLQYI